jgi:hypothetical protein
VGIDSLFAASTPTIPNVELGMADAKLTGVSTTYLDGGQYGEGYTINDPVTGHEEGDPVSGDPITLDCVTGLQFFAKAKNPSKQTRIMQALLSKAEREAWEEGEGAPTMAELLGRPCQVLIGENAKGYPTVSNVLPPRARRSTGRKAATTEAAE